LASSYAFAAFLPSSTNDATGVIMSNTDDASTENSTVIGKIRDRLFIAAYAVAAVISTVGWCIALGWAAIKVAQRL
jgi:hypothetical protein